MDLAQIIMDLYELSPNHDELSYYSLCMMRVQTHDIDIVRRG